MFAAPLLAALGLHFLSWKGSICVGHGLLSPSICFWRIAAEPRQHAAQESARYADVFRTKSSGSWAFCGSPPTCSATASSPSFPFSGEGAGVAFDYANTLIGISAAVDFCHHSFRVSCRPLRDSEDLTLSIFATGLSTIAMALVHSIPSCLSSLSSRRLYRLPFFHWPLQPFQN